MRELLTSIGPVYCILGVVALLPIGWWIVAVWRGIRDQKRRRDDAE